MPKISVIVPVYNVEEYLRECIDSILAQTFTDFELILVNDGSQDNSGTICDEYASKDNRITVIHQKNQGQASARNKALAIANGEWVHFVDSDDLIHPQMLEILYGAVDEYTHISICGVCKASALPRNFFSPKNNCDFKKHPINDDTLFSLYHKEYQYWIPCAKLVKKEIVEKYPFTIGRIYEDTGVIFKWINEAKFVNLIDDKLYFYRINPNSTTQSEFSLKSLDHLWAFEEQAEFYRNTNFKKMKETTSRNYAVACAKMYYRLLENKNWANEAQKLKTELKIFIQKHGKLIDFYEDWEFNMVYGILYPRPIRIIFRLVRTVKKKIQNYNKKSNN